MKFTRSRAVGLFLFVVVGAGRLLAAEETAHVEGRIVKHGVGIGGVTVLINELKRTDDTDAGGYFSFPKVPLGTYRSSASSPLRAPPVLLSHAISAAGGDNAWSHTLHSWCGV